MEIAAVKALCALGLFLLGTLGAVAAKVVKGTRPHLMAVCNAVAGGVLVGVSVVHMLSENAEKLEPWGLAVLPFFGVSCQEKAQGAALGAEGGASRRLGDEEGCEAFPLGFALFLLGAFLILSIEVCGGGHDHDHGDPGGNHLHDSESEDTEAGSSESLPRAGTAPLGATAASVVSASTAVGVSVHSFIEAVAMGSSTELGAFLSLLFAVVLHKGFTSFAVGSALVAQESQLVWLFGVATYAIAAPAGIITGLLLTSLEGPFTAAAQCFAAGTLLTIGLTDMLLPAVSMKDQTQRKWNLAAAFGAAMVMTILAAWV